MENAKEYKYLTRWYGSNYRQFFLKDRKIRAETLYRETVGCEPLTPEEVAYEFDVPLEAVLEGIDYCFNIEELLRQEREEDLANIRAQGRDKPPYVPADYRPET